MKNIKLALINIRKNIKNEKQLKTSFIISILGMALNNTAFLILWYYFGASIGTINGWEPLDVFGLYGFTGISIGLVMCIFSGLYSIPVYISQGTFDKFLLTPKNILLKVSTSKISTSAIGDFLYGLICFIIFAINIKISIFKLILSIILMILSSIIFYSFSLICMSISFYLMDGENVSQGLFGMLLSNSLYHGGAFTGILRIIFIYLIPSLLLGAIPVEIIKTLSITKLIIMCIMTIIWLLLSILFFNKSMEKYESNNFFGFGV